VRTVDQVVVHERRHVHELDRDARGERRLAAGRRREEDEQRAQPLAPSCERLVPDRGDEAGMARDRPRETLLDGVEVGLETLGLADRLERRAQPASPTCRATIPPANVRNRTRSKPHRSSSAASSSGGGKRRTLAGRYV